MPTQWWGMHKDNFDEWRDYRRMMRIPWTDQMTNVEVLNEAKTQKNLIVNIGKNQSSFFRHVMRRGCVEHVVIIGKIEGNRDR